MIERMTIEWPTHRDGSGQLTRPTSAPRGVAAETAEQQRLRTADLAREIASEGQLSGSHDEHAKTRTFTYRNPEVLATTGPPQGTTEQVDWSRINEHGEYVTNRRIPTDRQEVEITPSWQQANVPHR